MASRRLILPLLGSIIATGSGFQDLEPLPETYCVTYLSTYLLPLSAVTTDPVARESSSSPSSNFEDLPETFDASLSASTQVNTSQEIYDSAKPSQVFVSESGSLSSVTAIEDETITTPILQFTPTATSASTTGAPGVPPGGRAVLFRVTVDDQEDTRGIQKRDIGGFVGTQTDDCNAANTFRLVEGQLIDNDAPIFYAGEYFKPLRGQQGAVPEGAITKTFASQGGILTFTNSDLPNGGPNFCQDPNDGQVYITFTSAPANCVPVRLAVVDVELCDQEGIVESTTLSQSLPVSTEPSIPSTASSEVPQNPKTTADASEPIPVAPTSRLQTTSDFIPPPIIPTSRLQTSSFRFFNTSTFSNPPAASTEQVEPTFISLETFSTLVPILPDPSTSEVQSVSSEAITQPEATTTVPSLPTDMLSTQTLTTNIPIESDDTSTIVIESTTVIAVSESEIETLSIETTTFVSSEASLVDTATVSETTTSSDMEIDSTTTTGVITSEETTSGNDATTTADTTATEDDTTTEDATTTDDTTTTDATSTTTADTTSGEDTTASTESDIPTTTEEPTTATDAFTTTTEAETTTTTAAPTCESVLANPTPVSQSKIAEDGYDYLQPEFDVGLFEDTYQNLFISPFGILSLTNGNGLDLSNQDIPTSQVDPLAIFAYWDNMEPRDSEYDITYEYVTGGGFGRLLIFNYCVYTNAASTKPNHFTITFYEDYQSFIRVNYYQTENQGGSASIGVQNNDVGKFLKQSFNQAVISDRTEIDFDTRDGQEYIDTRSF